ncbi:hypothetical protein [Variovorax atrisoli]|uniref:hypothetical protein n=1 Tax=Variovorax atrisoli TaxID=3394203 RepID=UPI00339B9684
MTSFIAWLGVDSRGPTSMYFASDSRISWDKLPGAWDCGQKVFASNSSPEIFGFTGYVLLPQSILNKACSFIDRGLRPNYANENFQTRVSWLQELVKTETDKHPNRRIEDFTIFYGQRLGAGMPPKSEFHLHVISWDSKARELSNWPVLLPRRSAVLKTHGTGKSGVDKWNDVWTLSDQGNTSRTMFSAFCDSLRANEDPMSGGEPQLVGLYRQGAGQTFGVVTSNGASVHGSLLSEVPRGVKIEWRDELFQRVDVRGELLTHAQPHSRPAQVKEPG